MADDTLPQGFPFHQAYSDLPPASATARVEFGAETRRGRSHSINEDHHLVIRLGRSQDTILTSLPEGVVPKRFEEFGYAMFVADGMNETGAGERASRLALTTLMQLILYFGKWSLRVDDQAAEEIMERARRFLLQVDVAMVREGRVGSTPALQTSLTATFGAGRDLFFAHVGHSRAYLCRAGQLMRLTRDHTLSQGRSSMAPVAPLVDVNTTARDLKHILTETLGMGGTVGPSIDIERFRLEDRDRVLVCTNGLTDVLDEEALGDVLASDEPLNEQCRKLVDLAMAAGGDDDTTALIARYRFPE